jgi:uncharacterized protein
MRRPLAFAIIATLAASVIATPSRAQTRPSAETMEAAQELFTQIFAHAFVTQNAMAVETAWPGIESALRAHRPDIDPATLADLRREFERIRLTRLSDAVKDLPAIYARYLTAEDMRALTAFYSTPPGAKMLQVLPRVMPEAFSSVLPRLQAVAAETQDVFLKALRDRGLIN